MSNSKYRKAMFVAFSFPAALFVVLPFAFVLFSAPLDFVDFVVRLGTLVALLMPIYVTGILLAPWAGRRTLTTKGPAFLMAAAAALSSAVVAGTVTAFSGSLELAFSTAAIIAFFALPASLLGALLFIGGCERLRATTLAGHEQV